MKKLIFSFIAFSAICLYSCGGGHEESAPEEAVVQEEQAPEDSVTVEATEEAVVESDSTEVESAE